MGTKTVMVKVPEALLEKTETFSHSLEEFIVEALQEKVDRLERLSSEHSLPCAQIEWTCDELQSLAGIVTREPAQPTERLIQLMKNS